VKIRILGAGLYGVHLGLSLAKDHDVEVHEIADCIFAGATGNIPARLHMGQHYPRSKLTRQACREHHAEFMDRYGDFTHSVACNIYAIASHDSLVDFGTYHQLLSDEIELITIDRPGEFGLRNVEGAILTGERHVQVDALRAYFTEELGDIVKLGRKPGVVDDPRWDLTIDCTSCAYEGLDVDHYEACLTLLLKGPTDRAVTIMDGPFPSLYPWDELRGLSSLTSAEWTPLLRTVAWQDARDFLDGPVAAATIKDRSRRMLDQMNFYYPLMHQYKVVERRTSIRAMPRSAADARLVDVVQVGQRALRVRAGKLDAIFYAERRIKRLLPEFGRA
jgi:hypothetical protein